MRVLSITTVLVFAIWSMGCSRPTKFEGIKRITLSDQRLDRAPASSRCAKLNRLYRSAFHALVKAQAIEKLSRQKAKGPTKSEAAAYLLIGESVPAGESVTYKGALTNAKDKQRVKEVKDKIKAIQIVARREHCRLSN